MVLFLPPRVVRDLRTRLQHRDLGDVVIVLELLRGPPGERVLVQQIEIGGDPLDHVTLLRPNHGAHEVPHPGPLMAFLDLVARRVHELPHGDPLRCPADEDVAAITVQVHGAKETFHYLVSEEARRRQEQTLSPGAMDLVAVTERLVKAVLRGAESSGSIDPSEGPPHEVTPSRIDRFDVEATLAPWSHGTVVQVRDPTRNESVAMKLLHHREGLTMRQALEREHRILAAIDHPNVVAAHEVGVANRQAFMTMELLRGSPMDEWVRVHRPSRAERIAAIVEAGRGLAATHAAGFVHGNFCPANVLIDEEGRVRLIGFFRAHAEGEPPVRESLHTSIGLVRHAAPEVHEGGGTDARSDQFSLCVALYEAVHGTHPFPGDSPVALMMAVCDGKVRPITDESVPQPIRDAIMRGLSAADDRWPSVDTLLDELEASAWPE